MSRNRWEPFAYVPTDHTGKLSKLGEHEYFGEDFMNGKSSVALFRTASRKYTAVWSYGDWDYGCEPKKVYGFQHTQTLRRVERKYICKINHLTLARAVELLGDLTVTHWTLK